jgi:peptide deformylase
MKENLINIEPADIGKDWSKENLIQPLVSSNDPILREELPLFNMNNPPIDPIYFAHVLAQNMLYYRGLGLAANQIGYRYRAFVMAGPSVICCYNPRVVDILGDDILEEEGCLTFPKLIIKVKRKTAIKVQYTEPNGNVQNKTFTNMSSRIFQHELDHLNGTLFMDRATDFHYKQAKNKKRKYEKEFKLYE